MYPLDEKTEKQIANNFTHHPPSPEQVQRYQDLRAAAKDLATLYATSCPPSRELSLALTNLEQSTFWANAAIARNETPEQ